MGVTVDVGGVSSWVSPGIAVESLCMPRPLDDAPPADTDEPGAAMPDTADVVDVVVVGLESAPASESELVVVVVEVLGVLVPNVVPVRVVELLS